MAVRAAKRRRLSPAEGAESVVDVTKATKRNKNKSNGVAKAEAHIAKTEKDFEAGVFAQVSGWDDEQDYEQRPRKLKSLGENKRLPIKTAEGWVEQVAAPQEVAAEEPAGDDDSFLGSGEEDELEDEAEEEVEVKPKMSTRRQILQAKEDLAKIAGQISEDPETNINAVKLLEEFADSPIIAIQKLALATQLTVYKDQIPSYPIRPIKEDEISSTKISKEVRKLRSFEQTLLNGYHKYLQRLGAITKKGYTDGDEDASLVTVAYSCVCNLLVSVAHFNFRDMLLGIVVRKLANAKEADNDFRKCIDCIETLFRSDEDGYASLDAVRALHGMIKNKHYRTHESVLNTFLQLRLLSELSVKGSQNRIDKAEEEPRKGKTKWKKEFRTKREKKLARENKAIEKEMNEADAAVSHEDRDKNQSESLKMVFVTYFQVLKKRSRKLMGAVLEGLAKYSHLINQDFFGDILEVLKELIASSNLSVDDEEDEDADTEETNLSTRQNATRSSLLCCVTAFALLQGQDSSYAASTLHLDLSFFIAHLYRTLLPVSLNPDIEYNSKTLRLPEPGASQQDAAATSKVNVQTTTVLLIRSLTSVLLPAQAIRSIPPVRIAAFVKQLLIASLQLPEKSSIAMLGLLNMVAKAHGKKIAALWRTEERRGDGVFDALSEKAEGSNPFASTAWEGEILRKHYCPKVREAYGGVERMVREAAK